MLSTKLKEAAGNGADATLYVDDVFSTYLYTGTGAAQTITNGIDLAGKGGLVWVKSRSAATNNFLFDTARGVNVEINSNTTDANATLANSVTAFNSSGFAVGSAAGINVNAATYASWTFREAAKFFDVVTYSGDSNPNHVITHSLGVAPGMIVIKCTSSAGNDWPVYHRSASGYLLFNDSSAQGSGSGIINVTSSSFSVDSGYGGLNDTGQTYVAYLFAHDTSSTGIIQCGSFTTNGSGNATVNLGWEPQYCLMKTTGIAQDWRLLDTMRGWAVSGGNAPLFPNTSGAEGGFGTGGGYPTATGFNITGFNASTTYIYMAIRRPNKPPTTGTQVYNAIARTGTGADATVTGVGFAPDLLLISNTNRTASSYNLDGDRLRGLSQYLTTNGAGSEFVNGSSAITSLNMDGFSTGASSSVNSVAPYINWIFKRAPGFFDEVCYTGTGVARTVAHNLTVAPELMIVKNRSSAGYDWLVYHSALGAGKALALNTTGSQGSGNNIFWNSTTPTSSVFTVGTISAINLSGSTVVAYLFATLAGISKVGSYTGNGTGQAIACGFSAGARFVLIKRTDDTGDWYTFDSARGLTSGSSPYLLLNSTAAEVTGNNGVYASTGGFTLGSTAITTTNIATATYIFLAVA